MDCAFVLFFFFFFHRSYRIFYPNLRISSGCCFFFFLISLSDDDIFVRQNIELSCQENVLKNQDCMYVHINIFSQRLLFCTFKTNRTEHFKLLLLEINHEINHNIIDASQRRELGQEVLI